MTYNEMHVHSRGKSGIRTPYEIGFIRFSLARNDDANIGQIGYKFKFRPHRTEVTDRQMPVSCAMGQTKEARNEWEQGEYKL